MTDTITVWQLLREQNEAPTPREALRMAAYAAQLRATAQRICDDPDATSDDVDRMVEFDYEARALEDDLRRHHYPRLIEAL